MLLGQSKGMVIEIINPRLALVIKWHFSRARSGTSTPDALSILLSTCPDTADPFDTSDPFGGASQDKTLEAAVGSKSDKIHIRELPFIIMHEYCNNPQGSR